jgi:molybdopterin-binding protein
MKISARNQIKGEVVSVETDKVAAAVKVRISVPATITSTITRDVRSRLGIKKSDKVTVIIKASSVMIGKED